MKVFATKCVDAILYETLYLVYKIYVSGGLDFYLGSTLYLYIFRYLLTN